MLGIESRNKTLVSTIKGMYGNSKHLWMWDYKSIESELRKAGFKNIRLRTFGDSADEYFKYVEEEDRFYQAASFECSK